VISRKKSLLLIQITIFLIASILIYNTYSNKNEKIETLDKVSEKDPNVNSFTDVAYSGFDLGGNRYLLNAEEANFKTETPELINMKRVTASFNLKDGTVLTVISNKGIYNNITLDMEFKNNVKADYLTHTLLSDLLTYSNSNSKLIATGNVSGESIEKGEFSADNVEYDLTDKKLKLSMFGSKRVNVKIKN